MAARSLEMIKWTWSYRWQSVARLLIARARAKLNAALARMGLLNERAVASWPAFASAKRAIISP